MVGCLDPKTAKSHRDLIADARQNDLIPLAPGGIVLRDEIGDLAPGLQAKLLRVLNGEMQFRVGTEGNADFGFVFRGLVALATWRDKTGNSESERTSASASHNSPACPASLNTQARLRL